MRSSLWIVIVIVGTFMGFLMGYSISAYTGTQQRATNATLETSGYGEEESGGYGGGGAGSSAPAAPMDKETADYYKNLAKDEE